jgi:hypothetical protein
VPPIPVMEEEVRKSSENNEHCGNSRPEPYEQQYSAAGGRCVKKNMDSRAALPDGHHCLGQQIEA